MCGIAGLVAREGERPPPATLANMGAAIAHRGPDEGREAVYGRAGFAFRRLAIIDVAGGAQPLHNEDATCHLVLNGEIYNHIQLRRELEASGHRMRTHSDAEVVVHGYEEWGDGVVERLRGMFAFALWDEPRQRLLLARDRLGKKPLAYHEGAGGLAFASELGALLADTRIPRDMDLGSIHQYLALQYVPPPGTAYAGVKKLPPAHTLVFEAGVVRLRRYWRASALPPLVISEAEAAEEVRRLLAEAVSIRLMSEVPLGAFLSGGLDSSTVVALMAEHGRVKTFSIGFEDDAFDERPYAREVARRYGTEHEEFVVRPSAAEVLPALVDHYGEPFADSSALPTWYLSRLTRSKVTVALNGDGGDELFAGYPRYAQLATYQRLSRIRVGGSAVRDLARRSRGRLPVRVRRWMTATGTSPEEAYARSVSVFTPEDLDLLYSEDMRAATAGLDALASLEQAYREADSPDLLGRILQVDLETYLPGDLLVKVDIASMAHGLEARSPFLDHPLVEFAARLPSRLKAGAGGKRVLRRAVRDLLPPSVLRRRKMGFGVPVARWLRGELRGWLDDLLLSGDGLTARLFTRPAVRALVDGHVKGRDHSAQLWALLVLELWARRSLTGVREGRGVA